MRSSQRAFTLLETLVMLIISALVVALMFQVLGGFNRARQRVAALEGVRNNRAVLFGWFRDSVRSIVAITPQPGAVTSPEDPSLGLKGDANGYVATTLMPLLAPAGTPVTASWQVRRNDGRAWLHYQETGQQAFDFDLGSAEVTFDYLDAEGHQHEVWPPEMGVVAPLPTAVELTVRGPGQSSVLVQSLADTRAIVPAPYTTDEDQ